MVAKWQAWVLPCAILTTPDVSPSCDQLRSRATLYRNDGNMTFAGSPCAGIGPVTVPIWDGPGCVDFDKRRVGDLFVVNGHVYPQVDYWLRERNTGSASLSFRIQKGRTFAISAIPVGPTVTIPQPRGAQPFLRSSTTMARIDVVVENIDGSPLVCTMTSEQFQTTGLALPVGRHARHRLAVGAKVRVVAGELCR